MKILVFTEGTATMHKSAQGLSRKEIVKQSEQASFNAESAHQPGSVYDYANYVPNGNAVEKLTHWKEQGATICYLTSRTTAEEIEMVKNTLKIYHFPDADNLYYRNEGEEYKNVVERVMPDILIEDDCESIGGEQEMTITHIKPELKAKIKFIVVKEFEGIDHLPDDLRQLMQLNGNN